MLRKPDVVEEVASRTGLSLRRCRTIINSIGTAIGEALSSGDTVHIENFGRFKVHNYPSKTIPDLRDKSKKVVLFETKVVKFKPADRLRKKVEKRKGFLHRFAKPIDENGQEIDGPPDTVDQLQDGSIEFESEPELTKEIEQEMPPKQSQPTDNNKSGNLLVFLNKFSRKPGEQPASVKEAIKPKQIHYESLSNIKVDKKVLNILPELFARRHKAVPIAATGNNITVAMVDPENLEIIQLIRKSTGLDVVPVLASSEDVNRILNQYSGLEKEVETVIKEDSELGITTKEIAQAEQENVEISGDDSPTSRIVLSLLRRAVREKASDIHIEPQENSVMVRFRVDGVLKVRIKLPKTIQSAIISRLKILANLKIDEHRLPQDGRFRIEIDKNYVDFRLSILPVADGEKAVMRVLDKSQGILSLEEVGLRGSAYDVTKQNVKKSYGMTLVCGPTGSGKTTTLYALLGELMDVGVNIVTLENPIEYQIEGINQSQTNPDISYDFADGLRAIVRQDPDIIMVGEIRDKETAEIAVQSALTGHIVLSTLHTNNASGAFPRLIDMGVEPFLISSSVNTVIAQRLARRVCDQCKEKYQPSEKEMEIIKAEINSMPEDKRPKELNFVKGKGCDACEDTGYKGRLGIFEVLGVTDQMKELIVKNSVDSKIEDLAVEQGMLTLIQDGIAKAADGLTSVQEVWRVTKD